MRDLRTMLAALDARVDAWFAQHRSPNLDALFYSLSSAADHGILWHGIGVVEGVRTGCPGFALRFSAALGVEAAITNGLVKSLFRRVRPADHFEHDEPLPYGMRRPITSSFPSGHAATAFMCAAVLGKRRPATAPLWFGLAALVASSRVYVRMHHASDVIAGAALGLLLAPAAGRFVESAQRRR